ncbi:hypothetical protein GOV10_01975, partial [Candidatus Woesearchaeota archaeon]|nr:hypothetical protein [Candidatus Woesearchaeota archaeon]
TAMGMSTPEYESLIGSSGKSCASETECGAMFNSFTEESFITQKASKPSIDVEAAMEPVLEQTEYYVQVGYIQCAISQPPSIACDTTIDCEDNNPCTTETCIKLYSGSYCDYQVIECS